MPGHSDTTLIVGLGATGLSCVRFLSALGEPLAVVDSRRDPPGLAALRSEFPELPVTLGPFREAQFRRARRLLLSPGVAASEPAVRAAAQAGVEVLGDVELFARHADAPVVAVTGANGKSTVVSLLDRMCREAGVAVRSGGNLGPPALDLLGDADCQLYLLELSSFQLETTSSLRLHAACVLNISPDHMDRYPDLLSYAAAKWRIFRNADHALFNRDDPLTRPPEGEAATAARWRAFAMEAPHPEDFRIAEVDGCECFMDGGQALAAVTELRLRGRHNQSNALAALALGRALQLPAAAMRRALGEFPGLPHRTQWLCRREGVDWYNDSKGTNVGAALAALNGFAQPLVWIAGGEGKGADFAPLRRAVAGRARAAVLIGRDARLIAAALDGCVPIHFAADMRAAVATAAKLARPGDAVLLSPACASFDMFEGFAHRGEVYAEAVMELAA